MQICRRLRFQGDRKFVEDFLKFLRRTFRQIFSEHTSCQALRRAYSGDRGSQKNCENALIFGEIIYIDHDYYIYHSIERIVIPRKTKALVPVEWDLRLYVSGGTTRSDIALRNLKRICEEHLAGCYRIEIVDITKNPQLAQEDQIQAVPTLVRKRPLPIRKIIGILSDTEQVLADLDMRERS